MCHTLKEQVKHPQVPQVCVGVVDGVEQERVYHLSEDPTQTHCPEGRDGLLFEQV